MNLLLDQSVLQVGLGESGLACARWALAQGARLTVIDTRETPPGLQELQSIQAEVRVFNSVSDLDWDFNRVVVSPGLPPSHPLMVAVLAQAQRQVVVCHPPCTGSIVGPPCLRPLTKGLFGLCSRCCFWAW